MIVILTSGYPFGGEPFLISENNYAPKNTIYISLDPQRERENDGFLGRAFKVYSKKNKLKSLKFVLKGFFDKTFWKEMYSITRKKKFFFKRIFQMICFYGGSMKCYEEVLAILKKNNCLNSDTVIYSYWMSYHAFIAATLKKKYPMIKCVTRCHGYDVYEYRSSTGYLPFRQTIFEEMNIIYPISLDGANYIKNMYGSDVFKKVKVAHLGTKPHGIFLKVQTENEFFNIVSCSSLISLKRVDKIIMSLSKIQDKKVRWIHYGDGPLKTKLMTLAEKELSDLGNIKFCFYGQVDNNTLMEMYSREYYDLFINVSSSEGIPVSIREAMSFGIPTIATDVGGTSEIVNDGFNGFLLSPNFDVSTLASLIERYIGRSVEQQNIYRQHAYNTWNDKFNAKKNYEVFYKQITNIR